MRYSSEGPWCIAFSSPKWSSSYFFPKASTFSVFRPGSTSPAAILYDAWELFTRRSPKADELIRNIRPELASAVDDCIDAAGREWEPYWQRRLLNVSLLICWECIVKSFVAGCQVRPLIFGPVQSHRICDDGPDFEGSQRRPVLRSWDPYYIFTVSWGRGLRLTSA